MNEANQLSCFLRSLSSPSAYYQSMHNTGLLQGGAWGVEWHEVAEHSSCPRRAPRSWPPLREDIHEILVNQLAKRRQFQERMLTLSAHSATPAPATMCCVVLCSGHSATQQTDLNCPSHLPVNFGHVRRWYPQMRHSLVIVRAVLCYESCVSPWQPCPPHLLWAPHLVVPHFLVAITSAPHVHSRIHGSGCVACPWTWNLLHIISVRKLRDFLPGHARYGNTTWRIILVCACACACT